MMKLLTSDNNHLTFKYKCRIRFFMTYLTYLKISAEKFFVLQISFLILQIYELFV